jgi:hypothetical protein
LNRAPLGAVLRAALLAGVAAGLVAALFHFVATEPVLDRAIALEEQARGLAGVHEEPLVTRGAQKIGLFVGFLGYGLSLGMLFAVVYHAAQRWLPGETLSVKGGLLALASWWAVTVVPFARYPASPPGVADPETVAYRQGLHFGVLLLSVVGTAVAVALVRRRGWWGLAFLGAFSAVVYAVAPAAPDVGDVPSDLVVTFRALSLGGLTLFWVVFGGTFAWLLRPAARGTVALARA